MGQTRRGERSGRSWRVISHWLIPGGNRVVRRNLRRLLPGPSRTIDDILRTSSDSVWGSPSRSPSRIQDGRRRILTTTTKTTARTTRRWLPVLYATKPVRWVSFMCRTTFGIEGTVPCYYGKRRDGWSATTTARKRRKRTRQWRKLRTTMTTTTTTTTTRPYSKRVSEMVMRSQRRSLQTVDGFWQIPRWRQKAPVPDAVTENGSIHTKQIQSCTAILHCRNRRNRVSIWLSCNYLIGTSLLWVLCLLVIFFTNSTYAAQRFATINITSAQRSSWHTKTFCSSTGLR